MKIGVRFSDNDFSSCIRAWMEMFIIPTFVERKKDHFVTHMTSSMIVESFNTHVAYVQRFMSWYYDDQKTLDHYRPKNKELIECQLNKDWLVITESNVYWDDKTDVYISDWNGNNNCEFIWTNGKEVFIT